MARKGKSKSAPKSSRRIIVDDDGDDSIQEQKKKTKASKSKRSKVKTGDDETTITTAPKSKRSILKNSSYDAGDPADEPGNKKEPLRSWKDKIFRRKKSGNDENQVGPSERQNNMSDSAGSVMEADAMSTAQETLHTKTTQANRHTKTIEDCETEYHDAIREHDWEYLESLLKEYDPSLYKRVKKTPSGSGKRNLKLLKYLPDVSSRLSKGKGEEEPEIPISPLLALDSDGRSPLHLCCVEGAPSKVLLRVLNSARDAAAVKDKDGNLPLHLAIQNRCKPTVIERLVRGYYQGSWSGDDRNRTPLTMAIDVVIQMQKEEEIPPTKTFWGFPACPEDIEWQKQQEQIWKVPAFLVQNRFDRRKRLLTVEHNQILLALNKCAPPKVISNMLATGKKHLVKEDVAEKVLFLIISRQYPLSLLKWFAEVISIPFIKDQQDFTGCGVVAAQFRIGCMQPKTDKSKRQKSSFAATMRRLAILKEDGEEFVPSPQYTEWWEKLRFFINLWASHFWEEGAGDADGSLSLDDYLLHNALLNPDSPPLLIQLLAQLYPNSILKNHPKTSALPIHFACRQWQYRSYPPRRGEKAINLSQVCSEFLKKDRSQTRKRHRDRLPLHHAIAVTKPWQFIKPLIIHDTKSLFVRDPVTRLRPFQMAALRVQETFDIETVTRREYTPMIWNKMSDNEQDRQMRKLLYHYDLKQLDLVFELLRRAPDAVEKITITKDSSSSIRNAAQATGSSMRQLANNSLASTIETKFARSLFGLGNVQGHFIGWCYEPNAENVWKTHRRNFAMVKEAIIDGFVPIGMDKWWRQLNFWLWQDCPWNNIPRRADFLLHCALCNPKVSPWVVELILECFPRSATLPLPGSDGCYPLHIACITETYIPLPFEFANKRSVIEMVAKTFHDAILLKWNDRLPLHYAILGSKQWSEMKFMADDEPVSLAIPETESDFFPFQLMALRKPHTETQARRFENIMSAAVGRDHWARITANEKSEQLKEVLEKQERETIGCIFEFLKRNPMLVHVGTVDSKSRGYRRGNGSTYTNESHREFSLHQYLNMLESGPSSENYNFLG